MTIVELSREWRAALGLRFRVQQERFWLRKFFNADGTGFVDSELEYYYQKYLARKAAKGENARNPVEWCLAQKGKSRILVELHKKLGRGYQPILRRAMPEYLSVDLPTEAVSVFRKFEGAPLGYLELRRILKKAGKNIGQFVEVDHILEKRFLKSPKIDGNYFDEDDIFSFLVPKNESVAHILTKELGSDHILYVHITKTRILNSLIPHGYEDFFTIQQWWDAHVFTFESMGVPKDLFFPRLKQMFEQIEGKGRNFRYRTGLEDKHFLPPNWLQP